MHLPLECVEREGRMRIACKEYKTWREKAKILTNQLTPWSRILLGKLTVTQLVNEFPTFMESERSSPCSQKAAIGPYPEPNAFSPPFPTLFS
jgi:hypothetical protein